MKHSNAIAAAALLTLQLLVLAACGGPELHSGTWLLVLGADTLTVGDLGEAWTAMEPNQREVFTEKENTVGEFIVTYGRRLLLEKELEAGGYLTDPEMVSMADSWLRETIGVEFRRILYEAEEEAVTQEQVDEFMDRLGVMAYFTIDPGTEEEMNYGPVHMPSLPEDMLVLMDSLENGMTGTSRTGLVIRLDSIGTADSVSMAALMADTAALRRNIISNIANREYNREYDELMASLNEDEVLLLDTAALEAVAGFHTGEGQMPSEETILMETGTGSITVGDLQDEMSYYSGRYSSFDPADTAWLLTLLELIHYNGYAFSVISGEHAEVLDSLEAERDVYLLEIAAEEFYTDTIASGVTVTEADMRDFFENMEEPLTVPETRSLQAVRMPRDSATVLMSLPEEQRDERLAGMEGFPMLAADPENPQMTRPLEVTEIPGFYGDEVFLMDPLDTLSWLGPLELYSSNEVCMFRLLEVFPEREATFEEIQDRIMTMTRSRLEEQATVDVMRRLEDRYGMMINEDILSQLPEDPALWIQL
ncbi:MAG: hypothetical protein AVO35_06485 [Candidatus Aegiribacteria sp. MLS_C]|nr:MAG: hypothetical protein AVO35_06485 [Candidatus Aegiribacteria sp. MLS_C]